MRKHLLILIGISWNHKLEADLIINTDLIIIINTNIFILIFIMNNIIADMSTSSNQSKSKQQGL